MSLERHILNLISSLRDLPEQRGKEEPRGTKGEPAHFGAYIAQALASVHSGRKRDIETVRLHWAEIIGSQHAGRCTPERLTSDGTLLVRVRNPILREELRFKSESLLLRLRSLKDCAHIKSIALR